MKDSTKRKISLTLKRRHASGEIITKNGWGTQWKNPQQRSKLQRSRDATYQRKISLRTFDEMCSRDKRRLVLQKFGKVCSSCSFSWVNENDMGPYEIHHKDGNHDNWSWDNLEVLCLNCHWKTPNWRFRNQHHTEDAKKRIGIATTKRNLER